MPKVDVQVSGTWRSDPGTEIQANMVVTSAIANSGPQPLGRNLSSGNITVNLIPQGTLYSDRRNNIDFRVSKILRFGRTRTQVGIDIYNILNSDTITSYNTAYVAPTATAGSNWLTPIGDRDRAIREVQRAGRFLERKGNHVHASPVAGGGRLRMRANRTHGPGARNTSCPA